MEMVSAKITWDVMADARLVPVAPGVAVPQAFDAEIELKDGGAAAGLRVEVVDGVPRCMELRLSGKSIGSRDVRVPVQAWLDRIVALSAFVTRPGGAYGIGPDDDLAAIEKATSAVTRRRPVDENRLQRAADAYRAAPPPKVLGVQAALNVSEAQAYRLIRRAREIGVLEPKED